MKKQLKKANYLTKGLSLLAFLAMAVPVFAQQCEPLLENKRFTLVLPHSPGGGFDGYARVFTPQFEALTDSVMRIRYLPGAGAMLGINAVLNAGSSDLVLGLFNPVVLLNDKILGRDAPDMDSLVLLGALYTDTTVWATRNDNLVDFGSAEPRVFALASNSDFVRILLPGYALGWNINLIRGYSGSSDGLFALLRGDIDFFYSSSISLAKHFQSTEGLNAFLSLTDSPIAVFPEAGYLAGEGGVVEQLTSELDVEQQRERQEIARLAVELAKTHRTISVSRNVGPELVSCLLPVVEAAIFSDELRNAATAQNLMVEPKNGATLKDEIDRTEALIESNWDLLQELVARSR